MTSTGGCLKMLSCALALVAAAPALVDLRANEVESRHDALVFLRPTASLDFDVDPTSDDLAPSNSAGSAGVAELPTGDLPTTPTPIGPSDFEFRTEGDEEYEEYYPND